jgi:cytochrome c oxidase subunit 2
MINEEDLKQGTHRLLETDNRLLVPIGVPIRFLITSTDVLHS